MFFLEWWWFFTSHQLCELSAKDIRACGAIVYSQKNRIGHCPLLSNKDCKKQSRGSYDCSNGSGIYVRWNDNCPVTIGSNYFTVTLVTKTERRVKNERRRTEQPHIVKMYNQGMGGVDVCDHENGRGTYSATSWIFLLWRLFAFTQRWK